jgi:CheY-like chemotaxis protein
MIVLIADDDAGFRYPISSLFKDYGFHVMEASGLDGTVEAAKKADIWIIDVRLPSGVMEGIQAVKQLAQNEILPKYPVIFISVLPASYAENELSALKNHKPYPINYMWFEKAFPLELLLDTVREITTKV